MKSQTQALNHALIEFYEKLSAWELKIIKGKGLSLGLIHALEILGAFGSMPMKALADKIGITMGTLTVQIDKMVKANLVTRIPHKTDRRSILVCLTASGKKLFDEHDALHLQLTERLTCSFEAQELQLLTSFLDKINTNFSKEVVD
ncbi:MarR family transcriptional regulator [Psychromonas sp. CNPT3]|uniref:MarR family winged helix-turn-helix transcriptional regulator n=1 Tax=Psychromonas sp. CNPT3 TaxID=314282 RepID=UPI00006E9E83|nr:MarR family transcriptional regulator [Psychromonas sp. CNPT3]AGH82200.1 MarR family transcriptional regulator [Psychromonas sp. CNPT3]